MLRKLISLTQLYRVLGVPGATAMAYHHLRREFARSDFKEEVSQIRINGAKFPIRLRAGTSDYQVLKQVFYAREYEEPSRPHLEAFQLFYEGIVDRGKTPIIVDCGANIGLASLWYLQRFPKAAVIALEPEAQNFAILRANLSGYSQAVALHAGISDHSHRLALSNKSDQPWTWETSLSETGSVVGITVQEALGRVSNGVPLLFKVDIEGFELQLFQSNYEWVRDFALIVFESHDWMLPWRGTAHAFYSALSAYGSRDYLYKGENVFSYSHALLNPSQK